MWRMFLTLRPRQQFCGYKRSTQRQQFLKLPRIWDLAHVSRIPRMIAFTRRTRESSRTVPRPQSVTSSNVASPTRSVAAGRTAIIPGTRGPPTGLPPRSLPNPLCYRCWGDGGSLRHCGLNAMPEELNEQHELVTVGSEFDPILKESSHEDTRSCADALGVEEVIPALGDP